MHFNDTRQSGLTLIELLIAMTLGLFLIGAVIQVFLGTKKTYSVVTSQSAAQESGRFALYFLGNGLRHAGHWGHIAYKQSFPEHSSFVTDNSIAFGNNNSSATDVVTGTDDIFLQMTGSVDGSVSTCLGMVLTVDKLAVDRYFIAPAEAGSSENISSLRCTSDTYDYDVDLNTVDAASIDTDTQTLVSGIENMQILYGLSALDSNVTQRYLDASAISANDWQNVRSIKVAVLASSNDDSSGFDNDKTYQLLDETYDASATGDRRARLVFQQTINLRNYVRK